MTALYLIPVILSFVTLAAHFLRGGNFIGVGICLAFPILLLVRRGWVVRVVQVGLLLGAGIWLMKTTSLIQERQEEGGDWRLALVIMASVTLFTLLSGTVFATPRLRRRYFAG